MFATYSRYKDFWIFADDKSGTSSGQVKVIAKDKLIKFVSNEADVVQYGKYAWLSTDKAPGADENIVIAISSMKSPYI